MRPVVGNDPYGEPVRNTHILRRRLFHHSADILDAMKSHSLCIFSCGAVAIPGFLAIRTTSYPSHGAPLFLAASLITRLQRFRLTALPVRFPATKATRPLWSRCLSFFIIRAAINDVLTLWPFPNSSSKSALDLMVLFTPTRPFHQTQMLLRPFARRAANTARPPLVDIRERKPWHFARFRLFG